MAARVAFERSEDFFIGGNFGVDGLGGAKASEQREVQSIQIAAWGKWELDWRPGRGSLEGGIDPSKSTRGSIKGQHSASHKDKIPTETPKKGVWWKNILFGACLKKTVPERQAVGARNKSRYGGEH